MDIENAGTDWTMSRSPAGIEQGQVHPIDTCQ
jgi:septum formation inhibitor-activating ATPase MinD